MAKFPLTPIGQRFTADFVASMISDVARKTAGTSRISTVTLSADPDLVLAVEANAVYKLTCVLFYDSPVAADFKWAFTGPAGFSGRYTYSGIQTASAAGGYTDDQHGYADIAATPAVGGGAAIIEPVTMHGIVVTGGTAGNFTLTWAQNTSTATNTTLQIHSFIELLRIG